MFDVTILGSSFSGSLLAWILASRGMRVLLLDRSKHPRFAIGESSTPVADYLVEWIAERWELAALKPLARWGTWQETYPHLGCGKKRGFTYFCHRPGEEFWDTATNECSLMVAASVNDRSSDTHWIRADVDQFLFEQAARAGVECRESCQVESVIRQSDGWEICFALLDSPAKERSIGSVFSERSKWLIDATGTGGALAQGIGLQRRDEELRTRSGAMFCHWEQVASWDRIQQELGNHSTVSPFYSDDSAQHHLMDRGWMWMLRFKQGLCSAGMVQPQSYWQDEVSRGGDLQAMWDRQLDRFPSIRQMFMESRPARALQFVGRLSRLWSQVSGDGWAMLPTTAGFIDPLHSTGIAHALSGVQRIAELLVEDRGHSDAWMEYGQDVIDETMWIDEMVSACYNAMPDFELFCMTANFYFLSAIDCEGEFRKFRETKNRDGVVPSFLSSKKVGLREAVRESCEQLRKLTVGQGAISSREKSDWLKETRERLMPWNHANLMDDLACNRYSRSAAVKG